MTRMISSNLGQKLFQALGGQLHQEKKKKQGGSDFLLLHLQLTLSAAAEAHNKAPSGAR